MISDEAKSKIVQGLAIGLSLPDACRVAGESAFAVRASYLADPQFLIDIRSAKRALRTKALELVTQAVEEGDSGMALTYLKLLEDRSLRKLQAAALRLQNRALRQKLNHRKFDE